MAIMITIIRLMADASNFFMIISNISLFLECPPRILRGFMSSLQKKPQISNNHKILCHVIKNIGMLRN